MRADRHQSLLTPQQRLEEVAKILARGVLALRSKAILAADPTLQNHPENSQESWHTALEHGATQG